VGFVLPNGVVLGHTEVLLRLLEFRDRARVEARIYALDGCAPELLRRARDIGVAVEAFAEDAAAPGLIPRLRWLRETLARNGDTTAVWLSTPVFSTFAFAMRVAPVQVFSALRYHPVRLAEIDGYITYGSWGESERTFHGQRWTVCPVPLALERRAIAPREIAELRARFPEKVLLGTLARPEKIASPVFLDCVAELLSRHPECGFLWTGHARHAGIDTFLRERGVAERCHFVGWVDTALYGAALDLFLESFPLGCGITGYQAMAAGVPLLSFLDANTVFGMRYWKEVADLAGSAGAVSRELLDGYPVACARTPAEYVEMASRLVTDPAFCSHWAAREAQFYADEAGGAARYSARYFDTLRVITQAACSRS
jgi:glycosyltransferase involved in cell wall biosynthesis